MYRKGTDHQMQLQIPTKIRKQREFVKAKNLKLRNQVNCKEIKDTCYADFLYFSLITIIAQLQTIISSHILRDLRMIPLGVLALK